MFESFFPKPKWFFLSVVLWVGVTTLIWQLGGANLGEILGFEFAELKGDDLIGLSLIHI